MKCIFPQVGSVQSKAKRGVYPLHMAPFERYMLDDDQRQFPMTFVVEFKFSGELNRDALQSAVEQALQRHPMLRATIKPAKSNRECWVQEEYDHEPILWGDYDDPIYIDGAGYFLDIRQRGGFQCWCHYNQQHVKLTAVFHHSACDGIGAYHFLGDVLWFYDQYPKTDDGQLTELLVDDLRKRMRANISPALLQAMNQSGEPVTPPSAQPLVAPTIDNKSQTGPYLFPQLLSHSFDRKQFRAIRLAAQEDGQNVNDLLMKSLYESICAWNQLHGADVHASDFCLLMPMDLREPGQPQFSATNLVSSSLVRRSASEIEDSVTLNRTLREEAMKLKHDRHHSAFMQMLVRMPAELGVVDSVYSPETCLATVIFSNAGDPTRRFLVDLPREGGLIRCGNLVLEDLSGASPLRNMTRATINIFTYRRELKICLRCDPQSFSAEDAQNFLVHYVNRIQESTETN